MNKADVADRVGVALRIAMAESRLTQTDLAERLGVTQAAVSMWVNGGLPSLDQTLRISCAFGWEPRTFLERAGILKPAPLEEILRDDPALDGEGVAGVLREHIHQVIASAQRRSRNPSAPGAPDLPAPVVESLSAQLLEASRGLAPLDTDILRAAVAVLLSVVTSGAGTEEASEILAEMRRDLPALSASR